MSTTPFPFPWADRTMRTGNERFRMGTKDLDSDILSFWQWSASDLISNSLRGLLAEYLVALDLGVTDQPRVEWNAYDLLKEYNDTKKKVRIEVKSAAYLQTWPQQRLSTIRFGIAPRQGWDAETGAWWLDKRRYSDAYVFCLLASKDMKTIDPLDLNQWQFFVLPTGVLDSRLPTQKTVGLSRLRSLGATEVEFGKIGETICAF